MKKSTKVLIKIFGVLSIHIPVFLLVPNEILTPRIVNYFAIMAFLQGFIALLYIYSWCGAYLHENEAKNIGFLKLFAGLAPPVGVPLMLLWHLGFIHCIKGTISLACALIVPQFIFLSLVPGG